MSRYRKKPTEVEAFHYEGDLEALWEWLRSLEEPEWEGIYWSNQKGVVIRPVASKHDDDLKVIAGDWIIRGVEGEYYPCKPGIFDATYEEVHTWSDLDWALFLLDGAEQSIADEFHGFPDPRTLSLLAKYRDRVDELRREYVRSND